jgi:carbonic anhydrase
LIAGAGRIPGIGTDAAHRVETIAMFDDLLAANEAYQADFHDSGMPGRAAKALAVLTCIDSRIDPLAMLGLEPGDAKIIRNAGARVTDDALRSLVLAVNLLGVTRVCVVQHTDCAMVGQSDDEVRERITSASGVDASEWDFLASTDQLATLHHDLSRIAECPLLPDDLVVGGFVFDVHTGVLKAVELPY